jgi:hypothetical protein
MFSNTLSFLSSRNVNDQVSHPYKTTGKNEMHYFSNLFELFSHFSELKIKVSLKYEALHFTLRSLENIIFFEEQVASVKKTVNVMKSRKYSLVKIVEIFNSPPLKHIYSFIITTRAR